MLAVFTMWPSPCATRTGRNAHAVDHAPEVHAQHPRPRRQRSEPRVGARHHARVVAHHVHGAEAFDRGRGERLHRRLVAHVGANRERVHAARADLLGGRRETRVVDVGEHHVHPRRREPLRQRQARSRSPRRLPPRPCPLRASSDLPRRSATVWPIGRDAVDSDSERAGRVTALDVEGERQVPGICEGRIVIVTGAARGIGREHALAFAREGARGRQRPRRHP